MKKTILFTAALAVSMAASAVSFSGTSMYLTKTDGTRIEHVFADKPYATFEGENLVITNTGDGAQATYPMAEVAGIEFSVSTGVEGVLAAGDVKFAIAGDIITCTGLEAGQAVEVYALDGAKALAAVADADGYAVVDASPLASGAYILAAGSNSFKFIK